MFSYFRNRSSGMAFRADKDSFARSAAVDHFAKTLQAYIDGSEKGYALDFAVSEIRALFAASGTLALELVGRMRATDPDDYDTRKSLITEAVQLIDRQTRRDWD